MQLVERNTVDAVLGRGDGRDPVDPAPDFNERDPVRFADLDLLVLQEAGGVGDRDFAIAELFGPVARTRTFDGDGDTTVLSADHLGLLQHDGEHSRGSGDEKLALALA